jgi:hypothetical protein
MVFHRKLDAPAAGVFHLKQSSLGQAPAARVFHFNRHGLEQTRTARVVHSNRRHLAPGRFHLNHRLIEQVYLTEDLFIELRSG